MTSLPSPAHRLLNLITQNGIRFYSNGHAGKHLHPTRADVLGIFWFCFVLGFVMKTFKDTRK